MYVRIYTYMYIYSTGLFLRLHERDTPLTGLHAGRKSPLACERVCFHKIPEKVSWDCCFQVPQVLSWTMIRNLEITFCFFRAWMCSWRRSSCSSRWLISLTKHRPVIDCNGLIGCLVGWLCVGWTSLVALWWTVKWFESKWAKIQLAFAVSRSCPHIVEFWPSVRSSQLQNLSADARTM